MSQTWGRTDAAGTWLHPKPIWTVAAVLLAAAAVTLVAVYRYHVAWTPLQRAYAPTYLRAAVMATLDVTTTGRYRLLEIDTGAGSRLALEDEVEPAAGTGADPAFRLTEVGRRIGARRLVWREASYPHGAFHAFLGRWIYCDRPLTAVVSPALWSGLAVLVGGLIVAVPTDIRRARARRHGRRLKGPELVSARQFNRRTGGEGIGFVQVTRACRRPTRVGVEPCPHHGRFGHRQIRLDPADAAADRGAR